MDSKVARALVVEPDSARQNRLTSVLREVQSVVAADTLDAARRILRQDSLDVVLTCLEMADAKGLDALVAMGGRERNFALIAILDGSEPDSVVSAARSLSDDCLFWYDLKKEALLDAVALASEKRDMLRQLRERDDEGADSKYKDVLDFIDAAVFVVSRTEGRLLYSNSTAKEWFGADIGEAVEDALEYDLLESSEVEMEISTKRSKAPRVLLKSRFAEWAGESACLITMLEISKQKRAEDAYLSCLRRLELVGQSVGQWRWGPSNSGLRFSGRFARALGIVARANRGSSLESIVHPEDEGGLALEIERSCRGEIDRFESDLRIRCQDGGYMKARLVFDGDRDPKAGSTEIWGSVFRVDESKEPGPAQESSSDLEESLGESGAELGETDCERIALVIDDEEVIRKALEPILRSCGFETLLAGDGADGIELYEQRRDSIELVVLDMNMPKVGGGKVYERIRSEGNRVPIVMTSGNDDKKALPFTSESSENSVFLQKPFGLAEVKRVVEAFSVAAKSPNRIA